MATPVKLPKGFVLDKPSASPDLPEGFVLDGEAPEKENLGIMPFLNRAISSIAGAPSDIMTALARSPLPFGPPINIPGLPEPDEMKFGSAGIERGMRSAGIELPKEGESPDTLPEFIGTGIGEVTSFLLPFTKGAQLASKGKGLPSRVMKSISDSIQKSPKLAAVTEVTGGAGAGGGRFVKEEVLPEGSVAGEFTEVLGGVAGGTLPMVLVNTPAGIAIRTGKTIMKKITTPFSKEGAKFRASEFLKKQVEVPGEAANAVIEETIGDLPPAVASGEKRLMGLYNQFRLADPVTEAKEAKRLAHSIYQLEQELRGLGYSAPELMKDVTGRRVAAIELSMNKRAADAMGVAQKKLDALPVSKRQSQESIIVRDELEKVMKDARENPDTGTEALWANVDKSIEIDPSVSRQEYKKIVDDLSRAQLDDIPSELTNPKTDFLTSDKDPGFPINVKEMQGMRSKLLETQRVGAEDGNDNKARIAGDMADFILDDMKNAGSDEALQIAIAGTRAFKERFRQGIVGRILGHAKSGAPSISPDLTLDVSIGRQGIKGSLDLDKVVVTPEAVAATKRYVGRSFSDFATAKGTRPFDPRKAGRWMENNREILDQYPDLREQFSDIASAREFANNTQAVVTQRMKTLRDPRISASARFLKAEPGEEIDAVFKAVNPTKATNELVKQARKDPTGEALEGLKGAYVDHIIKKSSVGPWNEVGEQNLSGRALRGFINENRDTLKGIFSQDELVRMEAIGKELVKVETAGLQTGTGARFEVDDAAANYLMLMNRVGAAALGRKVANLTGGGTVQTPGLFSARAKKFTDHLNKDRAMQLLHDAVINDDNGELLRTLLLPVDKPNAPSFKSNMLALSKQLNLWLIGTGSRVLDDIKIDEEADGAKVQQETFLQRLGKAEASQSQEQSRHKAPLTPRLSQSLRQPPTIIP